MNCRYKNIMISQIKPGVRVGRAKKKKESDDDKKREVRIEVEYLERNHWSSSREKRWSCREREMPSLLDQTWSERKKDIIQNEKSKTDGVYACIHTIS